MELLENFRILALQRDVSLLDTLNDLMISDPISPTPCCLAPPILPL